MPQILSQETTPFPRTRCSTRPDTNTNNGRGQDSSTGSNPSSKPQNSSTPVSNNSLSSSFPSPSLSKGLVFDLGSIDSWDSKEIGSPVVKRFLSDEEERWFMWYHGNSSKQPEVDSIGLAVSNNGIHWERGVEPVRSSGDVGMVMKCGQDWWAFDTMSIRPSDVVIMSSSKVKALSAVYWLYYSGFSSEKVDFVDDDSLELNLENPERFCIDNNNYGSGKIFKSLPGLAISQDGRNWARIEGDHHSGALFDVGAEKEWDSLFIASPKVVFHGNGDLRMYYHSFDMENGQFAIGIARSRDGIKWVKLGKIMGGGKVGSFDECGVMNASVVRSKKGGKYVMAYEGIAADGKRSIGLAVSPDGLKDWRRFQDEGVLKPSEKDGWDNKGIGSPCLVQMDGDVDEWRLYYRGIGNEGRAGIGMAFCLGNGISSFRRWTGFKL
ncbi:hypothetical protein GH714_002629 [Hevea brasiliensis]|uniref:Glycosyl hydrolase family 32 N-terminal domain-containing protein n=1 Tax=Hevea brasiliensis TaxID=3981 RepID=A0A6A6KN06_HEVBR|nr:hypothetical protein GH714_002629 [Hevea brasiliensis]